MHLIVINENNIWVPFQSVTLNVTLVTDELGYHFDRPIYFKGKLNEPMHIGMQLLHPAAADHSISIIRQQVRCIPAYRFGAER